MRHLKLLAMLGLILAVSGTAGALTSIPFRYDYQGPVVAHIYNLSQSVTYRPYLSAEPNTLVQLGKWYRPSEVLSNPRPEWLNDGEDNFDIFQIDVIYKGTNAGYNNITEIDTSHPLYVHGDANMEVVGALFNRFDTLVRFTSPVRFEFETAGDYVEVFVQPLNTAATDPNIGIGAPGGSGRVYDANTNTYLDKYLNIGYDASGNLLGDGPVLVLKSDPYYFGDEYDADANNYDPNNAPNIHQAAEGEGYFVISSSHGEGDFYYTVTGGTGANNWDTDFFSPMALLSPKPWAVDSPSDIRIHVTNDPIGIRPSEAYDWTVYSSDPLRAFYVPEPLTVLAVFAGISGLGAYVRRRRSD